MENYENQVPKTEGGFYNHLMDKAMETGKDRAMIMEMATKQSRILCTLTR
jgi:hypothetical protein